jgi:SAM-dependent methyltransferase
MSSDPRRLNQERFTLTAREYAGSRVAERRDQVEMLLHSLAPSSADALLDVACGPGALLSAFAPHLRRAVGVDLTLAMLREARHRHQGRPGTVSLIRADGERLPFRQGAFSFVTATWAFHHFRDPGGVLAEMVRVCRPGGKVAVGDLVGSPDNLKRARQNEIERLRDPAHVEIYSSQGLETLLAAAGLTVIHRGGGDLGREVGEWCRIAAAPSDVEKRVREMLLHTIPGDLAGLDPVLVNEEIRFRHRWVILVSEKR